MQTKPFMPVRHRQFSYINIKGRSKNYEFKYSLILLFLFRSLFVSFVVILSSFISHIARYDPSSTYKSTYERRTKINSTYFLERPLKSSQVFSNDETINFFLPTQNDRTLLIAMIRLAEKHQRIVF